MNHHHSSQYHYQTPIIASMPSATPHYSTHNNSRPTAATASPTRVSSSTTEFRGSTNPDEDWTKISDLAERRRIQNRIAQRNYRKKLKRRLEDLERRAASRSLSPNGDDTDGRSTRESSAEGVVSPPPTSDSLPSDSYLPPPVAASTAYTTSTAPYATAYRPTAGSGGAYSSQPPSAGPYYPPTTASDAASDPYNPHHGYSAYSYNPASQPTLSSVVEATCGSPAAAANGTTGSSYLPLPSARLSSASASSSSYGTSPPEYQHGSSPKTSPMVYDEPPYYIHAYAGLSDTPTDPSFFNSNYYNPASHPEDGYKHSGVTAGGVAIKQEH